VSLKYCEVDYNILENGIDEYDNKSTNERKDSDLVVVSIRVFG
jgi:hypothetical protein